MIFDSRVAPGEGQAQAVYMAADVGVLNPPEDERALRLLSAKMGGPHFAVEQVRHPSPYPMYHATATSHSILCPRTQGHPCRRHGKSYDHRVSVTLTRRS